MPVDDRVVERGGVQEVFGDTLHLHLQCLVPGIADQQAQLEAQRDQVEPLGLLTVLVVFVRAGQAGQFLLQLVAFLGTDLLPGVGVEVDVHIAKVLPNLDVVAVHTRDLGLQSGRDTATDGGIACGLRASGLSSQRWVEVVQRVKQLGTLREQALA